VRQGATKDEILDAAVEHVKVLEGTAAMLAAYRAVPPRPRNEVTAATAPPEVLEMIRTDIACIR
jgi:hypothetical protein